MSPDLTQAAQVPNTMEATGELFDKWATDSTSAVALHLKQKLLPVEGEGGVIFPPTYADIGYNIDTLSDGTRVATIDSVGSQANRLEPMFKEAARGQTANPFARLVRQITITVSDDLSVSIFDVGHRLGDALIRSTDLAGTAKEAFEAWLNGDASKLAKLAPTSILFGAWDSRDTSAKLPRIVQSVIRAWDVQELTRSAQYNPPIDYSALDVFSEEEKAKAEGDAKSPLAKRGFVHVPSAKAPGGVVARGPIQRDMTINLIALRRLHSPEKCDELRRYVLALSLVVATAPLDGFLRQGCLITPDPLVASHWDAVGRDGVRSHVKLNVDTVFKYAQTAATAFGIEAFEAPTFEKSKAKRDLEENKTKEKKKR